MRRLSIFITAITLTLAIPAGAAPDPVATEATEAKSTDAEAQPADAEAQPAEAASQPAEAAPAATPKAAEPAPKAAEHAPKAVEAAPKAVEAAPKKAAEPAPLAGWAKKKGFFLRSPDDNYLLKLSARLQGRYTLEVADGGDTESQFSIPRGRIKMSGHMFTKYFRWKSEIDFGKGGFALKDLTAEYEFVPGWAAIMVGQFKKPFSRQQSTSSSKQAFVDRAITDKAFGNGRSIGLMINNRYTKSPTFEYALALMNGQSEKGVFQFDDKKPEKSKFSNVPDVFGPVVVLRVGYNYGKMKGYSEADLAGGPVRFSFALAGLAEFDSDKDDSSAVRAGADFMLKAYGFSTTGGVWMSTEQSGAGFMDQAYEQLGFFAQAGFTIIDMIQPAVRFAMLMPDGDDNDQMEIVVGLSAYIWGGHKVKIQLDSGAIISEAAGGSETDLRTRLQLQASF